MSRISLRHKIFVAAFALATGLIVPGLVTAATHPATDTAARISAATAPAASSAFSFDGEGDPSPSLDPNG